MTDIDMIDSDMTGLDMTTRTWPNIDMIDSDMTGSDRTSLDMMSQT